MLLIDKIVYTSVVFLVVFIGLSSVLKDKEVSDHPVLIPIIVIGLLGSVASIFITGLISIWMR